MNSFLTASFQKNKSGCIIVLYDEDERIAPDVATKLVQRDVDNVFILSGGREEIETCLYQVYVYIYIYIFNPYVSHIFLYEQV